jgi:two-component system response regulator (stage 0 sporulation protein F)
MNKKILVVEDEESLRLLYEEELRAEGYEILTAKNGREAIRQLEEGKPDLIILDIVMPVMDGMEYLLFGIPAGFYELGRRCLCDQVS